MHPIKDGGSCCFHREVLGANVGLAFVDGIIVALAFSQLMRIHSRNSRLGWTRQKVFHVLVGSSNVGFVVYFIATIIASCQGWQWWSLSHGFLVMALPKILFFSAFLLLLSFWVDLCHQSDDDDFEEEELSFHEALLEVRVNDTSLDGHRVCLPLRSVRIRSRQRLVILVIFVAFVVMLTFAMLMWLGIGNPYAHSSSLAEVYVDIFAAAMLLLGGALTRYGILLCMKMRRVRSERTSSETGKVASLTVVSVVCFTSSAFVAFFTKIPVLYYCQELQQSGWLTCLLMILYHFVGSSVPSAVLLWIVRELPPDVASTADQESRTIAYIRDSSDAPDNPQCWTTVTSLQNQISRGSPI